MTMQLRDYQRAAVDAISEHFCNSAENPLVVVPTGGGKSLIAATFMREAIRDYGDTRILLLVHVKELVEQTFKTLLRIWPDAPVGIYSASLGSRDLRKQITMATIQSIYSKAFALQRIDLILVDECQLIPHSGNGMYRRLLTDLLTINPYCKMVGLTATHWRMSSGLLTEGEGAMFGAVAYEIKISTLLEQGHLVPPITRRMATQIDTSGVGMRGGEFVPGALAEAADRDSITQAAADEIVQLGQNRRSWLAFCSGVDHAHHVRDAIRARGISCETITGETPAAERAAFVRDYRAGIIRCLTNADVLTIGFDAPATDLLAILRPTKSAGLWLQIIGRGLRPSPDTGKVDALVLDYTDNSTRFGPIDKIRPKSKLKGEGGDAPFKECPVCEERCHAAALECLACGHQFPEHDLKVVGKAADAPLLSAHVIPEWHDVSDVRYRLHQKAGSPPSLRVDYYCGFQQHAEWVCFEHPGYPRQKAGEWWTKRAPGSVPPATVAEALKMAKELPKPAAIMVRPNGKFADIVGVRMAA